MRTVEAQRRPWPGLLRVAGLLVVELMVVHVARHLFNFECHAERYGFCGVARNALLASYSLAAVLVLLSLFDRAAWRTFVEEADTRIGPLAANVCGLAVLLVSLAFLRGELSPLSQSLIYLVWLCGASSALGGAALMIAPLHRWQGFVAHFGWRLPMVALAGVAAPFVAIEARPFWNVDFLADQTFRNVTWLLNSWGQPVVSDPAKKIIGSEGFSVNIAPSCSGIEGLVLTAAFSLIYLALFYKDLRFPRAFLILPVALVASWLLNSVRIAVLVQIGISGQPALAIGGFHSHAGWLMFTLLSLAIVLVTQSTGLLRANKPHAVSVATPPPFFADPIVAQILPFAVFMASALLASTFSQTPGIVYPLRVFAMALALAVFWRYLRALAWRIDPAACAVGAAIGVMWIAIPVDAEGSTAPYGALTGGVLALWFALRGFGTVVLVPVIEELFFRGYLENRLRLREGVFWRVLAAVVTAALFAFLHDRWAEAFVAGLAFSWTVQRSGGRLTDAIVAHAVANAIVFAVALATGQMHII